jgi:ribosome-associated protein
MLTHKIDENKLINEFSYKTSRSRGAGGQHVNKVSSKVELVWKIVNSEIFNKEEQQLLFIKLKSYINKEGELKIQCEEDRSQIKNKQLVIKKALKLIRIAFIKDKKRIATKPTKKSVIKKKELKQKISDTKAQRSIKKIKFY